jgi:hypothetical protein
MLPLSTGEAAPEMVRSMAGDHPRRKHGLRTPKTLFSVPGAGKRSLFGAGLPTPPQAPTAGLRCSVWRGQETGHSVRPAHEFMIHAASAPPPHAVRLTQRQPALQAPHEQL